MAKKLTSAKAKEILEDGTVHGKPLTPKQKRFFGAIAGGQSNWLEKYEEGGETEKEKEKGLPVYYGPLQFENCRGAGCAKIATVAAADLFGVDYSQLSPEDAWYKKAAILKDKGEVVWKGKGPINYEGLKVGDFVSLDRPGNKYADERSKTPGIRLRDNEANEHLGVIVGRDEKGTPLIRHGSESGKAYVQPITNLYLDDAGPVTLNYKPKSIYRSAALKDRDIQDIRYYNPPSGKSIPTKLVDADSTDNEKRFVQAINSNANLMNSVLGLSYPETKYLSDLTYGIFQNESEAGESSKPIGLKMFAANLAHKLGLKDTPASLSDVQLKYDYLVEGKDKAMTKLGKRFEELGVTKSGLASPLKHREDYNDEVKAATAVLAKQYNTIKKNKDKYQYDAIENTIYGDIPLSVALTAAYKNPSLMKNEMALRNNLTYGINAVKNLKDINSELIGTLPEVVVTPSKKKNGGWLEKYDDGGPVQENYNDYSMSAPEGWVGEGWFDKGRDYSPAWGGQFAMGGSLPGSVGFMYARTINPAPSNGPYAKKTKPSAKDGTNMRYYQEGLDFKPKSIGKQGLELIKLDQLTNFTNYNTKQPGGWLDKYEG